jgi:hypothetical protein
MSSNVLESSLVTKYIAFTRFQAFDRLLVTDYMDTTQNKVEYYYSLDNITWIKILFSPYTKNNLANFQATNIVIPDGTSGIWFKITLRRRLASSPAPKFNSLRFRYRTIKALRDLNPRYDFDIPAFLASREQEKSVLTTGANGLETTFPLRWWTLPEVDISNFDVIEFREGLYKDNKFLVDNIIRHTQGPELQLTHSAFETKIIRDKTDVQGILYLLD